MSTESTPEGRPMHELHRIVAEDNARFDELAEAWQLLTEREQNEVVAYAKNMAKS